MVNQVYALVHKKKEVLMNSSSGGAFTALSDCILSEGGYVFGTIYDYEKNMAKHIGTNDYRLRNQMRGSKYIQSNMNDCINQVCDLLKNGEKVLFTGTACQIAGLNRVIKLRNIKDDKYFSCDIICHGVASPLIWRDYLKYKTNGEKITNLNFRDKKNGWGSSHTVAEINGTDIEMPEFMKLFYSHTIMRDCCYNCKYATLNRVSDITIGDFWGINNSMPEVDSENGVSFVMLNSNKGRKLLQKINKEDIVLLKSDITKVHQPNFYNPTPKSIICDRVWNDYYNKGIEYILNLYASNRKSAKLIVIIKKIIDKLRKRNNEA